jgi:hypothetical protein
MRLAGFIGSSYTVKSRAIAAEELINLFVESAESSETAKTQAQKSFLWTPGLSVFSTLADVPRGTLWTGSRMFAVAGNQCYEVHSDGTSTALFTVAQDANPASLAFSQIELLVVSAGSAYCYNFASATMTDVTALLLGVPVRVEFSDSYFIVQLRGNRFQMSDLLNGTVWPGTQINEVEKFAEDVVSIIVNHGEPWVFGSQRALVYTDTGSDTIFEPIGNAGLIESGCVSPFAPCRVDNTVFWVGIDERGSCSAWRANGYTPQRISTHAVEIALSSYSRISELVSYAYQDGGHLFWCLYVPGADCTWVYDVKEQLWHKRAFWAGASYVPHHSWNHVFAFGKHLVGDWSSGNIYEMSQNYLDDAGSTIRRMRRAPIINEEMQWLYLSPLTIDIQAGVAPSVTLTDGSGNSRPPQVMLRISRDRGNTWGPEQVRDCGFIGEYGTRVIWNRNGRARYPVIELTMSDPYPWVIVDAYVGQPNG